MHQQTEYKRFLDHLTLRQAIFDNQGQNTAEVKWIVQMQLSFAQP